MKMSRTVVLVGTLTISAAWMGGAAVSGAWAESANAEAKPEAKKDRIDDRAAKTKDHIDDKTTVEKARLDDQAAVEKARVDDRAMAKKNEIDRKASAQATAKDTSKDTAKDTSSKDKKDTAGDEVTDAWITAKVKASFVGDKALNHSDIHVDTDHKGVLVLSGYVPNETVRAHAVSVARETKGVQRVEDKLEIKSTK